MFALKAVFERMSLHNFMVHSIDKFFYINNLYLRKKRK